MSGGEGRGVRSTPLTVCTRLCRIELCDGRLTTAAGRLHWCKTMVFVFITSCLLLFPVMSHFTSYTRKKDALM